MIFVSANERVLIDFKVDGKNPGFIPDGMTIDTEGFLYVATWGGSRIFKIDPKYACLIIRNSLIGKNQYDF